MIYSPAAKEEGSANPGSSHQSPSSALLKLRMLTSKGFGTVEILKDQMNHKVGAIYHILFQYHSGIWPINPSKGHPVLKVYIEF